MQRSEPPSRSNIYFMKISQLQHLLDNYHGKKTDDLGSKIMVHPSRAKQFYRHPKQGVKEKFIISRLELLLARLKNNAMKTADDITGHPAVMLTHYINQGLKLRRSATQLLCKRAATLMRLNMRHDSVTLNTADKIRIAIYYFLACLFRLTTEHYTSDLIVLFFAAVLFSRTLSLQAKKQAKDYLMLSDKNTVIPAKAIYLMHLQRQTPLTRLDNNHHLYRQCEHYSTLLSLPIPPIILIHHTLSNSYALPVSMPAAQGGIIIIGKTLIDKLDTEELYAVLAHEMGHIQHLVGKNDAWVHFGISPCIGVAFGLLSLAMQNTLTIDNHYRYAIYMVDWIITLAATALFSNHLKISEEKYADNIAKQLAGPLALSSSIRSMHHLFNKPSQQGRFFKNASHFLMTLGFQEPLSTHPNPFERMKNLEPHRQPSKTK